MDLIPICIFVTPKSRPPRRIKLIQCSVLVFQPFPKLFLTFFTMTCGIFEVSSELIGNMPEDRIFFLSESLRKSPVYLLYLPPHDRRGIAEVMALPRQVYRSVSGYFCVSQCGIPPDGVAKTTCIFLSRSLSIISSSHSNV